MPQIYVLIDYLQYINFKESSARGIFADMQEVSGEKCSHYKNIGYQRYENPKPFVLKNLLIISFFELLVYCLIKYRIFLTDYIKHGTRIIEGYYTFTVSGLFEVFGK